MNERRTNAQLEQGRIAKDLSEARAEAGAAAERLITTDFEAKGKLDNDIELSALRARSEGINTKTEQMLEKHAADMETSQDRIAINESVWMKLKNARRKLGKK
jgi:hypothetical protein